MIYFNKADDQMLDIKAKLNFHNQLTKEDFRVYGLRQADNPPILVEFSDGSDVFKTIGEKCTVLEKFFAYNGIIMKRDILEWDDQDDQDRVDYKIYIGIRRDIRENLPLTCAILKTIILYIDDKIELTATTKLGNIPKFS